MAYEWVAFYGDDGFVRSGVSGQPPYELRKAGGERRPMTSQQFYDHRGRAFIEQVYDAETIPLGGVVSVPSSDRAGTVPCHIVGWTKGDYQHVAHIVEDGRILLTDEVIRNELIFRRPRRKLHPHVRPFTWVAVYAEASGAESLFYQFDPSTQIEVSGEQIDRSRLRSMILIDGDGEPWIEQFFSPGARMLYRRRVALRLGFDAPDVVQLLGWNHDAVRHVSYAIAETRIVLMAGDFDPTHPLFHPVVPVPADLHVVGRSD